MISLDAHDYSERCTSCKRPIRCAEPLDECWCHPSAPREPIVSDETSERVRNHLRDGSPGPIRLANRSGARDGL